MAVVQISRVQHRRGLSTDLPSPNLAEGEIGFTLDTGEMFIGAPNFPPIVGRTAYPYQNLRILTEFSLQGLLSTLSYAYRYQDRDNANFPGAASFRANKALVSERLLQERLDETVSVKSYKNLSGKPASGNVVDDDTVALTNAITDVFTNKPRLLYFPAGVYRITDWLPIYPNTIWIGDGSDKTIILLDNTARSVAETVDIDGNSGDQIANIVSNITIMNMTLKRNQPNAGIGDVIRLNRASKVFFSDVVFDGGQTTPNTPVSGLYDSTTCGMCVRFDRLTNSLPLVSDQFTFMHCTFKNNTYSSFVTDTIDDVSIISSKFTNLYKGVSLGEGIFQNTNIGELSVPYNSGQTFTDWNPKTLPFGPAGFKVIGSTFRDIIHSGFVVFSSRFDPYVTPNALPQGGNSSISNTYINVGRELNSLVDPTQPAIMFWKDLTNAVPSADPAATNLYLAENNSSVSDVFDYAGANDLLRVKSDSLTNIILNAQCLASLPRGFRLGTQTFSPMNPVGASLNASQTNAPTGIQFDLTKNNAFIIDYSLVRETGSGPSIEKGELHIVVDPTSNLFDSSQSSLNTGVGSVNVSLIINVVSNTLEINYTDNDLINSYPILLRWSARMWDHSFNAYGSYIP